MDESHSGLGAVAALAEATRSTWMAANRADGQRLQACYELFRACQRSESDGGLDGRPGYAVVDPFQVCSTHLVAQLAVSCGRADRMISLSVDLTERCPVVLQALLQGRLDQRAAEVLVRQLRTVDDAVIDRVHREAVTEYLAATESGRRLGDTAVRDMIDRAIARHDPDGIRLRHQDAARARGVRISKGQDGMANLQATLAADEMAILAEALDGRAAALAATDPDTAGRTVADQRADALMAMICGDPAGPALAPLAPHRPDTPTSSGTPGPERAPLRPKITVIAEPDGGQPEVAFPRIGSSSIQALLAMLETCDGASIERIDPTIGAHDDPERFQTYRPTAALARAIRLRDGTCRHPGCTVPAELGDIDHVIPFNHDDPTAGGATCEDNHCIFCRAHHRFKTFSDWRYEMARDGTLTITAPDGTTMRTTPSGPLAAYRRRQQQDEADKWDRQQHRAPTQPGTEPPAEPTYFHRRAARTRTERRRAERTHQANRERTQRRTAERKAARAHAQRLAREQSAHYKAARDASDTDADSAGKTSGAPPTGPEPATASHPHPDLAPPTSIIENQLRDLLHPPPF